VNALAEGRLILVRHIGGMLAKLKRQGRTRKNFPGHLKKFAQAVSTLGVSHDSAAQWFKVASINESKFNRYTKKPRDDGDHLSMAGLLWASRRNLTTLPLRLRCTLPSITSAECTERSLARRQWLLE